MTIVPLYGILIHLIWQSLLIVDYIRNVFENDYKILLGFEIG